MQNSRTRETLAGWVLGISLGVTLIGCSTTGSETTADTSTPNDTISVNDVTLTELPPNDQSNSEPVDAAFDLTSGQISDQESSQELPPSGFGLDFDMDGVEDLNDNCVFDANAEQIDTDDDGQGDECDADIDGDDVPNAADFWPQDTNLPGVASAQLIYAHTAASLYTLNPSSLELTLVGEFKWPDNASIPTPLMADIALDEYGVLYGVSFEDLFICHPTELNCTWLGATPKRFNGLTFVSKEIMNTDNDALIATTPDGGWHLLTLADSAVTSETLGNYGADYSSNGDAFSIQGMGTFVTARQQGVDHDVLAKVNPINGVILDTIVDLEGFEMVNGLAGWNDQVFVFDGDGSVLQIMLDDGLVKVALESGVPWWGAGVRTSL